MSSPWAASSIAEDAGPDTVFSEGSTVGPGRASAPAAASVAKWKASMMEHTALMIACIHIDQGIRACLAMSIACMSRSHHKSSMLYTSRP